MPSRAFEHWRQVRLPRLDEIEAAHSALGGNSPGRRFTTLQINQSYAVMLTSQFQGYCRDFHEECVDYFVGFIAPPAIASTIRKLLVTERKLDRGNPAPGNLGADFGRFGVELWPQVHVKSGKAKDWQRRLELLTHWRNAIAHQDFDPRHLNGIITLQLKHVQAWRKACDGLASVFDHVMCDHLCALSPSGTRPW